MCIYVRLYVQNLVAGQFGRYTSHLLSINFHFPSPLSTYMCINFYYGSELILKTVFPVQSFFQVPLPDGQLSAVLILVISLSGFLRACSHFFIMKSCVNPV